MSYSQFVEDFREEFYRVLETKTNWGKEQLKLEFERTMIRILSRYLEDMSVSLFKRGESK